MVGAFIYLKLRIITRCESVMHVATLLWPRFGLEAHRGKQPLIRTVATHRTEA